MTSQEEDPRAKRLASVAEGIEARENRVAARKQERAAEAESTRQSAAAEGPAAAARKAGPGPVSEGELRSGAKPGRPSRPERAAPRESPGGGGPKAA